MTSYEKADMVIKLLDDNSIPIEKVETYMSFAAKAIIDHRFSRSGKKVSELPEEFESIQIQAVIAGLSMSGAENQMSHAENGISRTFKYSDMLHYIHANVPAYVGVL